MTSIARSTRPTTSRCDGQYTAFWTNTTTEQHPTFDGVAKPAQEVTVYAQRQGQAQPQEIGHVRASRDEGTWTLTSRVRLSPGDYAVTASQSGDTGPPGDPLLAPAGLLRQPVQRARDRGALIGEEGRRGEVADELIGRVLHPSSGWMRGSHGRFVLRGGRRMGGEDPAERSQYA